MLRFSAYFLVSLVLHALASLFLRESVVEAGRAQDLAKQPAVMLIQLPPAPAPAPATVAMTQPVAVEPAKPVVEPVVAPAPTVVKPLLVERKVEPRPLAKLTPQKTQPQKATPPKPVEPKAAPGPDLAKVELPSAATSAGQTAPTPAPVMKEVFSRQPSYLQPPTQPHYPNLAKRRNQQGVVLVEVRLDERGRQRALQIVRSSGVESLDEAALEAVADWQFRPETVDGRAVPSRVQIPIEFALTASR
ncbi:protein TonB [Pseudomonas sp. TE3786]